ncbi:hypothetical protein GCM10011515_23850 [Tsuneonella deserti]|uniref:Uncharacterized protein n=1 Tax=Tsuneonella deserti TaxID=2035528 RepID=A0ABQ1SC16_9SPHN|nr:hypothetical protein [Tsuneonella deserti]GGE03525.1 hypothetical protein GCM10011515_23850 [Tsuneonella deserti]
MHEVGLSATVALTRFRQLAAGGAALALLVGPVAAQAAPQRAAAPVEEGSELRSSWVLGILALAAFITAIIIATKDHNHPVSP